MARVCCEGRGRGGDGSTPQQTPPFTASQQSPSLGMETRSLLVRSHSATHTFHMQPARTYHYVPSERLSFVHGRRETISRFHNPPLHPPPPGPPAPRPIHLREGAAFSPEHTRRRVATAAKLSAVSGAQRYSFTATMNKADGRTPNEDSAQVDIWPPRHCHDFGHRYRRAPPAPKPMRWNRCLRAEQRLSGWL